MARLAQTVPAVTRPVEDIAPEETVEFTPPQEYDAPTGPSAEEETDFLNGANGRGESLALARANAEPAEEETVGALPELTELTRRIPPEAHAVLDQLFRAKFVKVQRVPARHLKNS